MAVYDVPPQAECRGGNRPVNRHDKQRFNVAYRSICRFNGSPLWRFTTFRLRRNVGAGTAP
ncbi:MAG: hypothetical protein LBI28_13815 [Treponema sp.]|nr:hypothetical protein [Treponema sp.]